MIPEEIKHYLIQNVPINIPYSAIFVLLPLLVFGFKKNIKLKPVILYTVFMSITDTIITFWLQKYAGQAIPYAIASSIFISVLFKIRFVHALICCFSSLFFSAITLTIFLESSYRIFSITAKVFDTNTLIKVSLSYAYYGLIILLIYILIKKDIVLMNLNRYSIFDKISNRYSKDSKYLNIINMTASVVVPMGLFLFINYSLYYYNKLNEKTPSPEVFFMVNTIAIIFSAAFMSILLNKLIRLKYYKAEWETQQKYLGNINELINGLRTQKHGFVNHMNIVFGLITLGEYANAKDYLKDINQSVSLNSSSISINNPTLSALINIKAVTAENKKIKFEVNVNEDLQGMNFKMFEIGEAIGNIIDNAIEASLNIPEKDRSIKIDIYTDSNNFIFQISNKGNRISPEVLEKIFEEGFTTKSHESGEHGFGLYITKKIIECHNGKIEVESNDLNTVFKIFLPRLINNEYKAS